MNRTLSYALLLLTLSLAFASCYPTRQLALTELYKASVALPFKIESIAIIDKRDTLLPMNWKVPLIGVKKREWKGNPPLNEEHRYDIETLISQSEKPDGVAVDMVFSVLEGVCQLNADWKSVKEYAKFKGELIINIPSRDYTFTTYAEMFYEVHPGNGTEKGTLRLYNQALKNVTHLVLKQVRDEVKF